MKPMVLRCPFERGAEKDLAVTGRSLEISKEALRQEDDYQSSAWRFRLRFIYFPLLRGATQHTSLDLPTLSILVPAPCAWMCMASDQNLTNFNRLLNYNRKSNKGWSRARHLHIQSPRTWKLGGSIETGLMWWDQRINTGHQLIPEPLICLGHLTRDIHRMLWYQTPIVRLLLV